MITLTTLAALLLSVFLPTPPPTADALNDRLGHYASTQCAQGHAACETALNAVNSLGLGVEFFEDGSWYREAVLQA